MTNPGLQIFEAGFRAGTTEAMVFVDIDRAALERMYNSMCLPLIADEEPFAYAHPNGAIWRTDNYPAGMDFTKDGWFPLYRRGSKRT